MSKDINALDLAISKLQEEKTRIIKKLEAAQKKKETNSVKKINAKDKLLIEQLAKLAEWWRRNGPSVEKTIKVTIKANITWTEDKLPRVDGYDILYNGKSLDFDELIRDNMFGKELSKYQKQINKICSDVDNLEKKYPDAKINSLIFK